MKITDNFSSLDLLRSLSALIVAWGHSRFLMFVPSLEVKNVTKLDHAIYFFAGFGPQAVIVFFVLSGFFITRSIENRLSKRLFNLKDYFTDRYFRLSVVAIPAIFLTLILDTFSIRILNNYEFYSIRLNDWLNNTSYSYKTFLGNLFYLQTLFFNYFGSNGPLWSLAYEWWFYVLAPFFILPIRQKQYFKLLILLSTLILLYFTNPKIIIYFIFWLMGSVVYYVDKRKYILNLNLNFVVLFFAILVFITATITRLRLVDKIIGDLFISISVAFLIYFLIKRNYKLNNKILNFFTNISYSLYAIHLPVIIFFISIFSYFEQKLQPTFFNSILNFLLLITTIMISHLFWYIFERNTNYLKASFKNLIK